MIAIDISNVLFTRSAINPNLGQTRENCTLKAEIVVEGNLKATIEVDYRGQNPRAHTWRKGLRPATTEEIPDIIIIGTPRAFAYITSWEMNGVGDGCLVSNETGEKLFARKRENGEIYFPKSNGRTGDVSPREFVPNWAIEAAQKMFDLR